MDGPLKPLGTILSSYVREVSGRVLSWAPMMLRGASLSGSSCLIVVFVPCGRVDRVPLFICCATLNAPLCSNKGLKDSCDFYVFVKGFSGI